MKISARDIDHLSLTLTEPEAAATRLLQLGFNLTPEGVEPRCICFQPDQDDVPNYIELLQGEPPVTAKEGLFCQLTDELTVNHCHRLNGKRTCGVKSNRCWRHTKARAGLP